MKQNNCYIILPHIEGKLEEIMMPEEGAFIICADGGYEHLKRLDLKPDILIGDFDSLHSDIPEDIPVIRLEVEKDVSDTDRCIQYAVSEGYSAIFIIGGMGGRCDHTVANLQNMVRYSMFSNEFGYAPRIIMADRQNYVFALKNDSVQLPKLPGYKLSLLSFTEKCEGVSARGTHYKIEDAELTNLFPLGLSNEFEEDVIEISVKKGTLLVMLTKDMGDH